MTKQVMSVSDKIIMMNEERMNILSQVKEHLSKNGSALNDNINDIMIHLNDLDQTSKRYQALVNAQNLIASLIKQIHEAQSKEEIAIIRKKLNYYINKIKGELKARGVQEDVIENYQNKVRNLRDDIAFYIRILKRKDTVNNINRDGEDYDGLSIEKQKELRKDIRLELNFNKRNKLIMDNMVMPERQDITIHCDKKPVTESMERLPIKRASVTLENERKIFSNKWSKLCWELLALREYSVKNGLIKNLHIYMHNVPKYLMSLSRIREIKKEYQHFAAAILDDEAYDYLRRVYNPVYVLGYLLKHTKMSQKEEDLLMRFDASVNWFEQLFDLLEQQKHLQLS